MLPGIHLILFAKQGKDMFKHLQHGYQTSKKMTRMKSAEKVVMERKVQKIVAKQQEEKSRFQFIKMFEVIGESVPQSILQIFIVMKTVENLPNIIDFLLQDFFESPLSSTLSTILSSIVSLIMTAGSMLGESAFIINGEALIPYHKSGLTALHTLLMVPVVLPRIIAISLIFASFKAWYALIPAVIGGLLYVLCFEQNDLQEIHEIDDTPRYYLWRYLGNGNGNLHAMCNCQSSMESIDLL